MIFASIDNLSAAPKDVLNKFVFNAQTTAPHFHMNIDLVFPAQQQWDWVLGFVLAKGALQFTDCSDNFPQYELCAWESL
jgi:hypothetical protein